MTSRAVSLFVVVLLASALFVSVFTVIPRPVYAQVVNLAPSLAPIGTTVIVTGSGFTTPSPATCTITSAPSGLFSAATCSYSGGSLTGSFVVASGAIAGSAVTYVVTATVAAETASGNFLVQSQITLTPTAGPVGTTVTVTGDGFHPSNTMCSFSSAPAGLMLSDVSCTFSAGVLTGSLRIASSANPPPTLYTITATPDVIPGDAATAAFTVTSIPTVTLTPAIGPAGTTVSVSGFGFSPSDTGCTITTAPPWAGLITELSCSASAGTLTGSFRVSASAPPIFIPITLTGTPTNDFASTTFTVTPPPGIVLIPTSGVAGDTINIATTSLFSPSDTSCTITSTPSSPALLSGASCTIVAGFVTGSFVVSSSASGQVYTITVTGSPGGDSASAPFTVGPVASLSSYSGGPGQTITVSGSGFSPSDTTCSLTNAGPNFITPGYTCTIANGQVTGSFTVLLTATWPTANFVTVTGDQASDSYGIPIPFAVVPIIALTPSSGNIGTVVTISGAGFSPADAGACTLTAVPGVPVLLAATSCTIGGSGSVSGGFTVAGTATPGSYLVTAAGITPGDQASALFSVGSPPILNLSPLFGTPGSTITVTGTGFASSDTSCTLTSGPTGLISASTCSVAGGSLTGSITVSPTALGGGYAIVATGSSGDFAAGPIFNVVPEITLSPTSGSGSTTVTVSGAGFAAFDAGPCNFPANFFSTPGGLMAASSCTISAGGILTASFTTVASPVLGIYSITVVGPVSSLADSASFTVTPPPSIILSPGTASGGDTITITGTGFNTADSSCVISYGVSVYPVPPVPFITSPSCAILNGVVTGSFVVSTTSYWDEVWTVAVTGNLGDTASAVLTIVPRITLSSTSGVVGSTVSITGVGFAYADTGSCVGSPACDPFLAATPVDFLTSKALSFTLNTGQATGSFVVSSLTAAGSYVITVTGPFGGPSDSASAIFTVLPRIVTLSPASGPQGTIVTVTGSQFDPAATTCALSSSPVLPTSGPVTCNIALGSVTGSFTVGAASAGIYIITVTTNLGDSASATYTVTGAFTLTPDNGPRGITVSVTGSNFPIGDTGCTIGSSPPGLVSSETCSISGGALAGTFVVSPTAVGGAYTVQITTTPSGLVAEATFTVPPLPAITLTPDSGTIGTMVAVSGTDFATTDTACSLSSVPGDLLQSPTCTVITGSVSASFTVAPGTAAGSYSVIVSGSPAGDTASAFFTVTTHPAPTFLLDPTSGAAGTTVTISGSNYVGTTCSLSSLPTGLFTSSACLLTSGTLSGGFDVAVSAPHGTFTVSVNTDAGETKSALFNIGATTLLLSAMSGPVGTSVTVSGSNYAGTSCTLSSSPVGLIASSTCAISSDLTGLFNVALNAPMGTYTVMVTTNVAGETGMTAFTVTATPQAPSTFALNPSSGPVGTAVTVSGSNYVGTTCSLSSSPSGLLSSSSCSISSSTLTGGFTVASGASLGSYTVTVTTNVADEVLSAAFTVDTTPTGPTFLLSPASAAANSGVTISGSNYDGTTCSLSSSPGGLFTSSSCAISSGTLSGGFTVTPLASSGGYTVTVNTDAGETRSATFSVILRTCIIATATFGSEAAPAVQFLRNFRDTLVLSTKSGSAFMEVFNAWYYSFSPTVANSISTNGQLQDPMRVMLYPLLGILSISTLAYSMFSTAPELGVVMAGLVASSLIGLVYFTVPALMGVHTLLRRRRLDLMRLAKISLTSLAITLTLLMIGEAAGSFLLLAIASSAVVLTCVIAVPVLVSVAVLRQSSK